jgi:hypothetical protein
MQKFLVLYKTPVSIIQDWMKTPEADRKNMEDKLKAEWDVWAKTNAGALKDTGGAGKTLKVDLSGVTPTPNDIMLYSIVEAESPDAAAALFKGHPHLQIPQSTIEVMPMNQLPGM